jgi:hypothetical protein
LEGGVLGEGVWFVKGAGIIVPCVWLGCFL